MPGIPAQPIESPNRQDIAGTQMVQTGIKLGSALPGAAHTMIGEHPDGAGIMKCIEL